MFSEEDSNERSSFSLPDMGSGGKNSYWLQKAKLSSQDPLVLQENRKDKEGSQGNGEVLLIKYKG